MTLARVLPSGALGRIYTPERLDIEYSPAKWHADRVETLELHHHLGRQALLEDRPILDMRYGAGPQQILDIFPSTGRSGPCCLILHGGFWRTSDKTAMHFVAGALSRRGVSCIVPNFDLCPLVSVVEIVQQVGEALAWTANNVSMFTQDNSGIFLLGHATGAHLGAMLLMKSGPLAGADCLGKVLGALLISGLYDLRRIPALEVNKVLQLDPATAVQMSPLLSEFALSAPLIIASAEGETSEFQSQSAEFAERAKQHGIPVDVFSVPRVGHFTILDRVLQNSEPYMIAFANLLARSRPP